jgi:ProP effector
LRAAAIAAEKEVLAECEANRKAMHRRAMQMRETLAERFPNCFKGFGQPKLPLKIRIEEDIYGAAPDLDRSDVCNALTDYARGASYHRAMIEGAARVDLSGNPSGVVDAGSVKLAAKRLRRLEVMR